MKRESKDIKKLCEELRAETGYSLMDCKMALSKFDYNKEKAAGYLGSNKWKIGKLI
jgi:translation elongation factor EF-Ts